MLFTTVWENFCNYSEAGGVGQKSGSGRLSKRTAENTEAILTYSKEKLLPSCIQGGKILWCLSSRLSKMSGIVSMVPKWLTQWRYP